MLQPDNVVRAAFAFITAVAAERTGVLVHAICVMANHYHAIVTDTRGNISDFYHYLHEFTAKSLNAERGRWENMWAPGPTSRVRLEDAEAVIDKVLYTLTNPVSSMVVADARKWPGLRCWWADEPITARRPAFFCDKGHLPETATLVLVPPPHLVNDEDLGIDDTKQRLAAREAELRKAAKGKKFVGLANIRKQKWFESPTTFAKRRGLSPRVATRDKWRRIEAINRNKQFEADYAGARDEWLAGNRDVIWPAGTFLMRVRHGVPCHPPPVT